MTRIRQIRNNFSGGIISKEVYGNVDLEQFSNSLEVCDNMIKQATGGLSKRTGTIYIASEDVNKDNYKLIPYPLSDATAFIICVEYNNGVKITAYLADDSRKIYTNTVRSAKVGSGTDFTKIVYVQNKTTLLIFIQSAIFRVNIKYDYGRRDYVLSVSELEYSFPPFGTAYSGSLSPVFMDNGDPNSNDGKRYGVFMNAAAFAALHEWNYRNNPANGWDCGATSFSNFCSNLQNHGTEGGYYQIMHSIATYSYNAEEVTELNGTLIMGNRLMLNYTSTDSAQPNLTWIIELTSFQEVYDGIVSALAFAYKFIDEYCPTTTVTVTESLGGSNRQIEKTIRQDLPQLIKIDSNALRYLNTAQPSNWRYELFADQNDYFASAGVYENRLYLGGLNSNPNVLVASSRTYQDWLNFSTGALAGDGIIENISSDYGIQIIKWLCGGYKLFIGTTDGVFVMGGINNNSNETVTPANAHAVLISAVPTGDLQPLRAMDTVFFVDSSEKRIYEIVFNEQQYAVNELSLLARDLYKSGIKSQAYMSIPQKLYWACMNDGTLVSMTYLKNINSLSASKHVLGTYTGSINTQITATHEGKNFDNINNTPTKINNIISINKGDLNLIVMDVTRYLYGIKYSRTLEIFNYNLHDDPGNISRYYVDCGFELLRYGNIYSVVGGQSVKYKIGANYRIFENLLLEKDWIGVGSTNPQEDTALNKINVDVYQTENQTIATLIGDQEFFIYKKLDDDGNFVNFVPGDIPDVLSDCFFWLGFSDFTSSNKKDYIRYSFSTDLMLLLYKELNSLVFDINLSSHPSLLRVKFINSGLVNINGDSIDGIHDFVFHDNDNLYYPDDEDFFVLLGDQHLFQDCCIVISFPNSFKPTNYSLPTYSYLKISNNDVPDRFLDQNWHACFITNIPEVPQINNREVYLRYNFERWEISYLTEGVYEAISINMEDVSEISVNGYCYFPYNYSELHTRLAMCPHLFNTKICLLLNHFYHYVEVDSSGDLIMSDQQQLFSQGQEYWYIAGGFNYYARMKTTSAHAFSPLVGDSTGLVSYQSEVTLQMYGCHTGYIGADFKRMNLIPYIRQKSDDAYQVDMMNPQVELINCHVFPSKDIYQSSICIVDVFPVPFQILSITQDVEYSDQ